MDYDQEAHSSGFVSGFLLGAILGASLALLSAPAAGTRTRRRIRKVAGELKESATDQLDDLAADVKDKVDEAVRGARKRFQLRSDG